MAAWRDMPAGVSVLTAWRSWCPPVCFFSWNATLDRSFYVFFSPHNPIRKYGALCSKYALSAPSETPRGSRDLGQPSYLPIHSVLMPGLLGSLTWRLPAPATSTHGCQVRLACRGPSVGWLLPGVLGSHWKATPTRPSLTSSHSKSRQGKGMRGRHLGQAFHTQGWFVCSARSSPALCPPPEPAASFLHRSSGFARFVNCLWACPRTDRVERQPWLNWGPGGGCRPLPRLGTVLDCGGAVSSGSLRPPAAQAPCSGSRATGGGPLDEQQAFL